MQPLQVLIKLLTQNSNVHICIHDVSGIMKNPLLHLDFKYMIHSCDFCNCAKNTEKGLKLCMTCKMLANKKAMSDKKDFCGYCPNGLYEICVPVCIDGEVKSIIYIGNLTFDRHFTEKSVKKICKITQCDERPVIKNIRNTELIKSSLPYFQMAEIIKEYILLCVQRAPEKKEKSYHWAVENIKGYAETYYRNELSLKQLANLYFINEKYIGRLFKKQIGCSFREYLNRIRIEKAEELLINTDMKVIDIAYETGFGNVTYFNRVFASQRGCTPVEYRRSR